MSLLSTGDVAIRVIQSSSTQCWQDPAGIEKNYQALRAAYLEYCDSADLVIFPELTLSGYIPLKGYDQGRKRSLYETADFALREYLPGIVAMTAHRRAALVVGFMEPTSMRNEMFNTIAYIEAGNIVGHYRKIHLPVEENHYFLAGDTVTVLSTRIGRVALAVCYDILFPEVSRIAALHGAELLIVPSNWLAIGNLRRLAEILPVARALEGQMGVVFANGVGPMDVRGKVFELFGESRIIDATGTVLASGDDREGVVEATLSGTSLQAGSDIFPVLRDRRPEVYEALILPTSNFSLSPPDEER